MLCFSALAPCDPLTEGIVFAIGLTVGSLYAYVTCMREKEKAKKY